ncbi:MAG: tetratricopeptide repeat protein [Planctomycetes bacterium]|nr:tetratricopeptide repeat protein [Planctomycetota bacterium]
MLDSRMRKSILAICSMVMVLGFAGCSATKPGTWFGGDDAPPPPPPASTDYSDRGTSKKSWWKFWGSEKKSDPTKSEPMTYPEDAAPHDTSNQPTEFMEATELVHAHKFEEAKQKLIEVINKNPRHAEAFRWLGDCYYNQMELEDAIRAYSKAREIDPASYYALRGKGFAHLHLGHEYWRKYEEALRAKDKAAAHENLSEAHENYKRALELLQHCLKLVANDNEAMYGRAMAAEGASRKLYANAVGLLRKGQTEDANAWAQNCLDIIDEGIKAAKVRISDHPEMPGPRKLVGGLFFRRAMLLKAFGQLRAAVVDMKKAAITNQAILEDIDPENKNAKEQVDICNNYLKKWEAELSQQENQ